ncbi:hypothetical protein Thermo_00864 [Thermoplasmatales archaeon]|nr:hypothetical protein Thermo_00864 [Thermoplasmatales archaeon]
MKKNFRAVGIDDGPFIKGRDRLSPLVGVLMRADFLIEKIAIRKITVDGTDSTEKIIEIVNDDFRKNAAIIMTYGVTFGGFNIADLFKVSSETGIPVISITRKMPDLNAIISAIEKTQDSIDYKLQVMKSYGIQKVQMKNGSCIFINLAGINLEPSLAFIEKLTRTGNIPEPVRTANIVASSLKA